MLPRMGTLLVPPIFAPLYWRLESEFFRGLNQFVEPLVRAGFGSPVLSPVGAIVLETQGRKTGRKLNVPLIGFVLADMVVVNTVRARSQWMRNLAANPKVRYWVGGKAREATAAVISPELETETLPPSVRKLANFLKSRSAFCGTRFAVLYKPEAQTAD